MEDIPPLLRRGNARAETVYCVGCRKRATVWSGYVVLTYAKTRKAVLAGRCRTCAWGTTDAYAGNWHPHFGLVFIDSEGKLYEP